MRWKYNYFAPADADDFDLVQAGPMDVNMTFLGPTEVHARLVPWTVCHTTAYGQTNFHPYLSRDRP